MFCTDPRTAGEEWCFWQISKQSKGVFTKLSVECGGAQVRVVRLTQGKVQLPTRGGAAPPWDRGADGVGGSSHGAHLGVPAGRCRRSGAEKAVGKQVPATAVAGGGGGCRRRQGCCSV